MICKKGYTTSRPWPPVRTTICTAHASTTAPQVAGNVVRVLQSAGPSPCRGLSSASPGPPPRPRWSAPQNTSRITRTASMAWIRLGSTSSANRSLDNRDRRYNVGEEIWLQDGKQVWTYSVEDCVPSGSGKRNQLIVFGVQEPNHLHARIRQKVGGGWRAITAPPRHVRSREARFLTGSCEMQASGPFCPWPSQETRV